MGLIEETRKQAVEKRLRTQEIIEGMIKNGDVVNYQTVAHAARVSRTYLYKHQEFRDIIELCRVSGMTKQELQRELIRLRHQLYNQKS